MAVLAVLLLPVMLYSSLYPFSIAWPAAETGLTAALRDAWLRPPGGRAELLANILFYMPLGLFLAAALPPRLGTVGRWLVTTITGAALSAVLETAQFFVLGRTTSGSDVILNTIGTGLGAGIASIPALARLSTGARTPAPPVSTFVVLLLFAWASSRLYPFAPTLDLGAWWGSLKGMLYDPELNAWRVFRLAVYGLVAAELVTALIGPRHARFVVPCLLLGMLAAEIVVVGHTLDLEEVIATAIALPVWGLLRLLPTHRAAGLLLALLTIAVLAERLAPFRFVSEAKTFGWIPFRSVFAGDMEAGLIAMVDKLFRYGALLWLGQRTGLPRGWTAVVFAALLLACGVVQTRLPGRSAEVTDAVLVLLAAFALTLFERRAMVRPPPGIDRARTSAAPRLPAA